MVDIVKHHSEITETEEELQQSIARALLGIISISIFIVFFLAPR